MQPEEQPRGEVGKMLVSIIVNHEKKLESIFFAVHLM